MTVFDVDPTVRSQEWSEHWEILREQGVLYREAIHRGKDGEVFPIESFIKFIRYNDREYIFAFARDITERKRVEAERERLQASLGNAVEIANLAPWEHDLVNNVFLLNDHFYRIYHTTAEQMGGYSLPSEEHIRRFVHPEDIPLVVEEMRKTIAHADSLSGHQLEHRFLYPDGKVGYMAVQMSFVKDATGKAVKVYGVNQDITERTLGECERLANLRYFESMEKVNRAIQGGAVDLDRCMEKVLDVCLSVFQCDRAFLVYPCDPDAPFWHVPMERTLPEYPGPHPSEKMIPMDSNASRDLRIALETDGPVVFNPEVDSKPSEAFWKEHHGFRAQMTLALQVKVGKSWLFGLHQCSHARTWTSEEKQLFNEIGRRLEEALTSLLMYRDLRKSEKFLSSILENIPDTIFVKDAEALRFLSINEAGEALLGFSREELIGKNAFDLLPAEEAKCIVVAERDVLEKMVMVDIPEETIHNKAGEPRIVHTKKIPILGENGSPQHLLTISEDITNFKMLQAQLSQAQKMEALGTMSGGIAHDFNNILQPMLGYCEFLKEDLPDDSPQQTFVDGIFKAGIRAKDLVNQILAFSRQSERQAIPVELQLVVKEAVKLCRSIISSRIDIDLDLQTDSVPILADPTQVHQIIMNLMVNAYHAMEETGGKISIRLKEIRLGEEDLKGGALQPGRYARLSISDTGCGMTPEIIEKIFEPYFTTKPQSKGTGLGLAVVYGIVKEHGGHINVYSETGQGTTFNIYLPLVKKTSEKAAAEDVEIPLAMGSEHILLVDDEKVIVQLESQMLKRIGYRITTCENGDEALAVFSENPEAFDLVITDMNMPGMAGDRLAREMIAIRPDIPIIICTGFSEKIGQDEARAMGVKGYLMKPVAISEMSRKVREVLDGK
jgi:PAS domain S-box-containing protein